MNAQLEQDRTSASPISGGVIATAPTPPPEVASRVTCKDKLLHQLHSEQDSLFAKINQFHDRKDAEKQRILDKCIEQCKCLCLSLCERFCTAHQAEVIHKVITI